MLKVNVGVIGFGTVGAGTVEILFKNHSLIRDRVGAEIIVKKIADLDIDSDRGFPIDKDLLTTDAMAIIDDPDIQIVVELIGGVGKAKDFIIKALERGKHVVTANKALLGEDGEEIYSTAERCGVNLGFEASVAGGIPIIRALKEGLSANRIDSIMGILNGTSNYILSRMTQQTLPYQKAVEEAIDLGYAEDPPTLDVNGTDAAHKLAILISIAFGVPVSSNSVYREGIERLTPEDILFAGNLGYCIKMLAITRNLGDKIEARVHPTMVPLDHIMANVNGAYNAIFLKGDFVGPNLYYGLGAGRKPTGSAVVSDIIHLARQIRHGTVHPMPPLAHVHHRKEGFSIQPMEELKSAYYFRFSARDSPGVLSKIAGIFGDFQISISNVIQKGREINGSVPVVMLTHKAQESNIRKAMSLMDQLEELTDKAVMIRFENN